MDPIITACICTHERYDVLAQAIASVATQTLPAAKYRVMVVDNSPDATRASAFASDYRASSPVGAHAVDFRWQSPPGLSRARNAALRECGTPLIAYLDDDAIADAHWLARLVAAFDSFGPEAVIAGGRVDPRWEQPRPDWLGPTHLGYLSVLDWGAPTRAVDAPHWLAGTNIAFRCDVLAQAGGFDEQLGRSGSGAVLLSNEEIALVRRFRAEGRTTVYVHDAVVEHRVPASRLTQAWFRRRAAWQAVSDYLLNPKAAEKRMLKQWPEVQRFLERMAPRRRGVAAFHAEVEDPTLFALQLKALIIFTLASLSGFEGVAGIEAP